MTDTARDDHHMQRPSFRFDFNFGTIVTLALAAVAGIYWLSSLEGGQKNQAAQILAVQQSIGDLRIRMEALYDNPVRIKALEEQSKAINARLDRIADSIITSQETMRRDMNASFETIRKDINGVSTKVEVLSSKIADPSVPTRTQFRP